jgi:integrase/recombinase XerD
MTTVPCWARVCGPLAGYAEGFRAKLEWLGYTPLTAAVHVRLMAHLSRWLAREGRGASGLSPAVVDAYFAERRSVGYVGHVTGRALRPVTACHRASVAAADRLSAAIGGSCGCCAGGSGKSR